MAHNDSIDKIVSSYFQVIAKEVFTYKNKTYQPKALRISPNLVRGFTCPPNCGACCPVFSLDYLPLEVQPAGVLKRKVSFNGHEIVLYSDLQKYNHGRHCSKIDMITARCEIHGNQPFSCDFELIRTGVFADPNSPNVIGQRLYGRAWALTKCDGSKGALCEMTPSDATSISEVRRKIVRLQQWADHFHLSNWCPEILEWVDAGDHSCELILGR